MAKYMSPVACCLIGKTGKIFKFRNKKVTLPQKLKKRPLILLTIDLTIRKANSSQTHDFGMFFFIMISNVIFFSKKVF